MKEGHIKIVRLRGRGLSTSRDKVYSLTLFFGCNVFLPTEVDDVCFVVFVLTFCYLLVVAMHFSGYLAFHLVSEILYLL